MRVEARPDALIVLKAITEGFKRGGPVRMLLTSPSLRGKARLDALSRLLGPAYENLAMALYLLARHRSAHELPEIFRRLSALAQEDLVVVQVTSALPLSAEETRRLETGLVDTFDDQILKFEYTTEPSLLAGVSVRIGDTIYDYSLRARLERLRQTV